MSGPPALARLEQVADKRANGAASSVVVPRVVDADDFASARLVPLREVAALLGEIAAGKIKCPNCEVSDRTSVASNRLSCGTCNAKNLDPIAVVRRVRKLRDDPAAVAFLVESFGRVERSASTAVWIPTTEIFAPLPPTPWLVPELAICPGRPAMLAAYGYSGKTIIAQAMALALASGTKVWGQFRTGEARRVRHFDFEQGRHATLKRYQRLSVGHGVAVEDLADRLEVAIFPTTYLNTDSAAAEYDRATDGYSLAILDALRGATPGEDENDSKIAACLHTLARVSERNGCAFLVLHHAGKPREGHGDARTVPRGSSAIFDACGCVFVLSGEKNGPKLTRQEKAPAEAEGGAVEDFYLKIEDVPVGPNPRAGVRVTHRTVEQVKPPNAGSARFDALKQQIINLVRSDPGKYASKNRICSRMQGGTKSARLAALDELLEEGRISLVPGGGYRVSAS